MSARILVPDIGRRQRDSVLGRTNALVKLAIAAAWLIGLVFTLDVRPPLVLAAIAILAGLVLGRIELGAFARRLLPLALAALGIVLANLLFSGRNADPLATELLRLGPIRVTAEAAAAAAGLGARVAAIVSVGAVFALTTDATALVDALVQLAGVSPRFAYGALAAYQAVPRLADDLVTIRHARRLRGLPEWRPRILVALLVRAIRHADELAIAMDARGFGSGPRTTYRPVRWQGIGAVVGGAGLGLVVGVLLAFGR
jgi:energy-coupling factor transport system permease protein